MRLTNEIVLQVFASLLHDKGYCSCQMVADELEEMEVISWTGKSPTRQAVYYHMNKTEMGQELIQDAKGKFPPEHFIAKKYLRQDE